MGTFARSLWENAVPHEGTPVDRYLAARGLPAVVSSELRFHPAAPRPRGSRLPAMIAAVRNPMTGELVAVHRTFLRPDGSGKADVEPTRASLGPVMGGAVMLELFRPGQRLVIGEGIETSLSAAILIGGVAWSAICSGNLARIGLPPTQDVAEIIIAADPDPSGLRAALAAQRRWLADGRKVRIETPESPGGDFNDVLRSLRSKEARDG